MKKFITFTLLLLLTFPLIIYTLTYKGEKRFTEAGGLPDINTVIANARSLSLTPYDPLMGQHGNIGGKLGLIVCSDIPDIAYGKSGYSFEVLMRNSFRKNPAYFDSANGNNPDNPFFHRRARNLYAYFASIQSLKPTSYTPQAGDLVFYRKTPSGYIAHVALVTAVSEEGYKIMESAPRTVLAQEVDMLSPISRGWILAGFGKVY